jgi:hypothetical protein
LQQFAAAFAFIEELAGVRRHQFSLGVSALWTGDCRIQLHERDHVKFVTGGFGSEAVAGDDIMRVTSFGRIADVEDGENYILQVT